MVQIEGDGERDCGSRGKGGPFTCLIFCVVPSGTRKALVKLLANRRLPAALCNAAPELTPCGCPVPELPEKPPSAANQAPKGPSPGKRPALAASAAAQHPRGPPIPSAALLRHVPCHFLPPCHTSPSILINTPLFHLLRLLAPRWRSPFDAPPLPPSGSMPASLLAGPACPHPNSPPVAETLPLPTCLLTVPSIPPQSRPSSR